MQHIPKHQFNIFLFFRGYRYARVGDHDVEKEENSEQIIPIRQWINHENAAPYQCEKNAMKWDYSIVVLQHSITFNRFVKPICLPATPDSSYFNKIALVAGWGMTEIVPRPGGGMCDDGAPAQKRRDLDYVCYVTPSKVLKYTVQKIVSKERCVKMIQSVIRCLKQKDYGAHICAYTNEMFNDTVPSDACQGDSGGKFFPYFGNFFRNIIICNLN